MGKRQLGKQAMRKRQLGRQAMDDGWSVSGVFGACLIDTQWGVITLRRQSEGSGG